MTVAAESCVKSVAPAVQGSLRVGAVNDPLEGEADAVADRVMRMPSAAVPDVVQRCPGGCPGDEELRRSPVDEEEDVLRAPTGTTSSGTGLAVDASVASGIGARRGGGAGLSEATRGFFEPRFGADFSRVRVHADAGVAEMAAGVNARAFTVGRDVFFGAGEFRPGTSGGDRLLAHELTHTLQQRATSTIRRQDHERPSPEEDFVRDLQTGTEKATQYLDYITRSVEYWRRHGIRPGQMDDALRSLSEISSRVSSGLDTFGSVLGMAERAIQIRDWFTEVDNFATATAALDFNDRETVRQWAGAMEGVRQKSEPFVLAAREWLARLARGGSSAAARGAVLLSVVSAYVEIGVAALQAGINNVNFYIERRERIIQEAFDEAEGRTRRRPSEPAYPGNWVPAAEVRRRAVARAEHDRLTRARLEEERLAREATREFETTVFPPIYRRRRRRLMRRILRDIKRGRPIGVIRSSSGEARLPGLPAQRWWDQLVNSGGSSYFDAVAGVYIVPKKDTVTLAEAGDEIYGFQRVRPSCPYFERLYRTQLETFLQQRIGSGQP